jgi:hypothetical protein
MKFILAAITPGIKSLPNLGHRSQADRIYGGAAYGYKARDGFILDMKPSQRTGGRILIHNYESTEPPAGEMEELASGGEERPRTVQKPTSKSATAANYVHRQLLGGRAHGHPLHLQQEFAMTGWRLGRRWGWRSSEFISKINVNDESYEYLSSTGPWPDSGSTEGRWASCPS